MHSLLVNSIKFPAHLRNFQYEPETSKYLIFCIDKLIKTPPLKGDRYKNGMTS